jgi:SecD/SecF fusion protein
LQKRGIWFILIVLGLLGLSIVINLTMAPRLGLDIAGGIRFTIRADKSKLAFNEQSGEMWEKKAQQTVGIIERRAAQGLGVNEATVYRKGDDKFIVELPGFQNEDDARKFITASARLQYYWARNVSTELDHNRPYEHFTATENNLKVDRFKRKGETEDKFLRPDSEAYQRMLDGWGDPILKGEELISAEPFLNQGDQTYSISLKFKPEGTQELNKFARRVLNRKEWLVAVLDKDIVSFAFIQDGVTSFDGGAQLDGHFTAEEAKRVSDLLNAGALPVDLVEENVSKVLPSIGTQALNQIITAGIASFAIISLFLLIYYVFPGFVAFLALVIYTLLAYAVFKWIGVTFSLAAIAGFILSVGMAVDANILIFERLKEELRSGRTLMTAIDLGFKRAFPAILDSNACTIITCVVLANIGTGPVKGFATTLMIGVLISLFTAVTVTRSLLVFMVSSGIGRNEKIYGMGRGWFGERLEANANTNPLHISRKMGRYFLISALAIVPGAIFLFMGGLKPNVEFLGGIESGVRLPENSTTSSSAINAMLATAGFKDANTKIASPEVGTNRSIALITLPPESNEEVKRFFELGKKPGETTPQEMQALRNSIGQKIVTAVGSDAAIVEKVGAKGEALGKGIKDEVSFETTGPAVRAETIRGAIIGVCVSSLLIVIYLAFRFGISLGGFAVGLRFGTSAIIAMLHDVLVIVGVSAIFGYFLNWEVSQLTITAVLTVIGFSVHDTIVIFDRIRENLRRPLEGETFDNLVDRSITQTLARSLNTSATVIVTLAILVFFGSATPDLKHFNAAMLIGILSGTYSSIFNAAPILVLWERSIAKRKGQGSTIMQDKRLRGIEPDLRDPTDWRPDDDDRPSGGGRYAQTKRKR